MNLRLTHTLSIVLSTMVNGFSIPPTGFSSYTLSQTLSLSSLTATRRQLKSPRFSQDAHPPTPNENDKPITRKKMNNNNSKSSTRTVSPPSDSDLFFQTVKPLPSTNQNQNNNQNLNNNQNNNLNQNQNNNQNNNQNDDHINNNNNNNNNNNDDMWRSNKSIEELEDRMSARWGTLAQTWTADPNEYEFVYGQDDDSTNNNNEFRGKPVLDPWQKAEKQSSLEIDTTTDKYNKPKSVFAGTKEDAVMNRVRRNQERLSIDNDRHAKTAKWKNLVNDDMVPDGHLEHDNVDLQNDDTNDEIDDDTNDEEDMTIQGEFYDEDDEGFELNDDNYDEDDDIAAVGRLISPNPVGGQGSFKDMNKQQQITKFTPFNEEKTKAPWEATPKASLEAPPLWDSGLLEAPSSPGFFFNPDAATVTNAFRKENNDSKDDIQPNKEVTRKESKPILDQDGNQLFLTLEQAKTFFAASSGKASIDSQNDDAARTWEELGITSHQLLLNLQTMGCASPLAVQDKACSTILTGNDVLVGTYTGSGKTLAFLVPLVQRLLLEDPTDGIQVLIVAPGRELASQIVSVARELLVGTDMSTMLAIGGTTFTRNLEQIRKRKPTIIVGTPGRMAELIVGKAGEKKGRLPIASLKSIVLDEFDALLEYKPHRDPTAALVQVLKNRHRDSLQSILCSATASDMMGSVKLETFLRPGYAMAMADRDDKFVTDGGNNKMTRVSKTVIHGVVHIPQKRLALDAIRRILHTEPIPQQVLIFADNARRVDILIEKLDELGIVAAPLHGGDKSEKMDRAEVSKALREGYVGIVVATELAARGLDAPLLTHVINLDLPTDASHYAHRAGRCGRGGRPGVVINITTGPKERNIPKRFADSLGVDMHTVEVRNAKLNLVDPLTIDLDPPQERY